MLGIASAQVFTDEKLSVYSINIDREDKTDCNANGYCTDAYKGDLSVAFFLNTHDFRAKQVINVNGQLADYDPDMRNKNFQDIRYAQSGGPESHPFAWPEPPTHYRVSWTNMETYSYDMPKFTGKKANAQGARGTIIVQPWGDALAGGSVTIPVRKKPGHTLFVRVRAFYADGSKGDWVYTAMVGRIAGARNNRDDCVNKQLNGGRC